ncbi:MAG: hypothetical protein DWQ08_10190 [Proteobacteria bacterium]|nr:MAG: hypothetical protein DWQ08_10190 [Pseudomonadota bacterium]
MLSIAVRLSVFYALVFSFLAVQLSYWPLWLKSRGLGDVMLGQLLAFGFIAKVAINPAFRHLAVRLDGTRPALLWTVLLSLVVFNLFPVARGVVSLSLLQLAFLACWVPVLPATEHLAIVHARRGAIDYGRVRLWGSLAFLTASAVVGALVEGRGIEAVFVVQAAVLTAIVLIGLLLPGGEPLAARRVFSLRELSGISGLPSMLSAAALVQSSHAMMYVFGSIYWKSLGIGEAVIGLLWAEAVAAEIAVFLLAARFVGKLTPGSLLALSGVAAVIRWAAMPFAAHPLEFAALQLLHGATFGIAHLGAMRFITERVAEELSANAVALYSMAVMGVAMGVAVFAAGWLFSAFGGYGFLAMAIPGLACAVLARPLPDRAS